MHGPDGFTIVMYRNMSRRPDGFTIFFSFKITEIALKKTCGKCLKNSM